MTTTMTTTEAIEYLVGTLPADEAKYDSTKTTAALLALEPLVGVDLVPSDAVRRHALDLAVNHTNAAGGDPLALAAQFEGYLTGKELAPA